MQSSIFLIEDSPGEGELFRLALKQTGADVALSIQHDAEAALDCLADRAGHHQLPSVILLDWHMHRTQVGKWLMRLRDDVRFTSIPVVVFTTSDDLSDLTTGYRCGANGYVVKPGTFDGLVRFIGDFCRYWLHWNRTAGVHAQGDRRRLQDPGEAETPGPASPIARQDRIGNSRAVR